MAASRGPVVARCEAKPPSRSTAWAPRRVNCRAGVPHRVDPRDGRPACRSLVLPSQRARTSRARSS